MQGVIAETLTKQEWWAVVSNLITLPYSMTHTPNNQLFTYYQVVKHISTFPIQGASWLIVLPFIMLSASAFSMVTNHADERIITYEITVVSTEMMHSASADDTKTTGKALPNGYVRYAKSYWLTICYTAKIPSLHAHLATIPIDLADRQGSRVIYLRSLSVRTTTFFHHFLWQLEK